MDLTLKRVEAGERGTVGKLSVGTNFLCWTLEDRVRLDGEKVPGETAIPAGRYEVRITWSPRFGRDLPLLIGVPGFEGVRIHVGNTEKDTEGCILVGTEVGYDEMRPVLMQSRVAFDRVFMMLASTGVQGQEQVWLTVEGAD